MSKIILFKNTNIHFKDIGKGEAVVLLHGFLENCSMWNDFTKVASKRYRVISIDLLGHGETGCLGYVHTMELMAEAVVAMLKHLRIRRSTFIGHSMGGYVALALAEQNPERVKGLCLMNSTSRADSEERKQNRDRAIQAVKQNHKTFVSMSIANLFRPKNRKIFSKEIKKVKEEALKTPLQGVIAALEGMKIRQDREVLLHFSPYKKMMVIGKKDPVIAYEDLMDQTLGSEVDIVQFADGHMSHIENKDELSVKLMYFIEK